MRSAYDKAEAARYAAELGPAHGEDLALRVYTSHLLGRDPTLVLHGGGNTSVKSVTRDLFGDPTEVLFVKGSGSDLASIAPSGFPACRLAPLRRCCDEGSMSDERMVKHLRGQMLDPASPMPSVEALLHAFLPAKFVDHTHADAVLAVLDQPGSEAKAKEIWGEELLFVPYVMPGFALAARVAELWRSRRGPAPGLMVLDKHGIFSWGETAEESYERMIEAVSKAEGYAARRGAASLAGAPARETTEARGAREANDAGEAGARAYGALAPLLRGALRRASGERWVLARRASPALVAFSSREDVEALSQIGCVTPDHVIRTRPAPLVLPEDADARSVEGRLAAFARRYGEDFRAACEARGTRPRPLDPFPRLALAKGLGAIGIGRTRVEAEIALDVYEHTAEVITRAASMDGYEPVSKLDLFDVETWSLEQAKLGKAAAPRPLDRQVALVTGAAGGIGLATAEAFLRAGAHVALVDRDEAALGEAALRLAAAFPGRVVSARGDVTDPGSAAAAVAEAALAFGGLDVVVSNAGSATTGLLHTEPGEQALRASLELNLLGHQHVARAAADLMRRQGTGGVLLFNASKSAFNQGPDFGPYAVAKAAAVALMRQYAVDLGREGIRANAVNADRIRTRLFEAGVLEARARARGLSVDDYFTANLLGRETRAEDVASAFLYLATADATTGCVVTVDGGNAAAFPR